MSNNFNEFERQYSWFLMTYAEPQDFEKLLEHRDVNHYAWIYHDKDNCTSHYHIALTLTNQKSLSTLRRIINSSQNTFGEKLESRVLAFEYLTHSGEKDKDKYQYSQDSIHCDNVDFWSRTTLSKEDENTQFLSDLITLTASQMAIKYGRDFIRYFDKYTTFKEYVLEGKKRS